MFEIFRAQRRVVFNSIECVLQPAVKTRTDKSRTGERPSHTASKVRKHHTFMCVFDDVTVQQSESPKQRTYTHARTIAHEHTTPDIRSQLTTHALDAIDRKGGRDTCALEVTDDKNASRSPSPMSSDFAKRRRESLAAGISRKDRRKVRA